MNVSISPTVGVIEDLFDKFNTKYFEGKMIRPVLTVSPDMTSGAYGWCTLFKAWNDGEDGHYEINITAEHLNRPITEIVATLIHEMVHLYNLEIGVQDCSRGGTYHNHKFKDEAEKRGLSIEKDSKYGWTITKLNSSTDEYVKGLGSVDFKLHRISGKKTDKTTTTKKKSSSRKYVCTTCAQTVRATKEVHIICGDCNIDMEMVD